MAMHTEALPPEVEVTQPLRACFSKGELWIFVVNRWSFLEDLNSYSESDFISLKKVFTEMFTTLIHFIHLSTVAN